MTARTSLRLRRRHTRGASGFTLVELMVAVTGGLFISLAVFAIARESGRFYNRESRMSDATMSAVLGFERLKTDVARAGFLGTPNIKQDPHLCGDPVGDGTWPFMFKRLAALSIEHAGSPSNTTLNASGNLLSPDAIVLMGSYSAAEEFATWNIDNDSTRYVVYLQQNTGPLARLGYNTSTDQLGLLKRVFGKGRGMRIQDQSGEIQFGTIDDVGITPPRVMLSYSPKLRFRQTAGATCGLKGNVTGAVVSVLNFVRYELKQATTSTYSPVYDAGGHPYDTDRTDLIRTELDTSGAPLVAAGDNTEEIVAEYAVNLQFGITRVTGFTNNTPDGFAQLAPGDPTIENFAGDLVNKVVTPSDGPNRVRAVRVRLTVRSQEPDRLTAAGDAGAFRVALGNNGTSAPYARLRTLQADVALNNQMSVGY